MVMARNNINTPEVKEFEEKVVQVNRVSKKTKGGNNIGFSVLMVVGNKKGQVGVGLGKAPDVLSSIKKGVRKAKKHMITVPLKGSTIPFMMHQKFGAAKVLLKPAPKGTGVIAGGAVRAVVEAAGIQDIVSKIMGSDNQASNVYATFAALKEMERMVKLKNIKLKADVKEEEAKEPSKSEEKPKKQTKKKLKNPAKKPTPKTTKKSK